MLGSYVSLAKGQVLSSGEAMMQCMHSKNKETNLAMVISVALE